MSPRPLRIGIGYPPCTHPERPFGPRHVEKLEGAERIEGHALVTRILDKCHPPLENYWSGRVMPANRVMLRVAPQQVRTWGLD